MAPPPEYPRFSCGHYSAKIPASEPLRINTSLREYGHSCAHCTREHCQKRESDIILRNSIEKRRLRHIIREEQTLKDYTGFLNDPTISVYWQEAATANERLAAIRDEQPEQIRAAWAFYNTLFPE